MSTAVISPAQPEQILRGLGKLWTSLGEDEKHQGKPTVLRACAMTLIAATDEPDGGYSASQTISELMREHPSRGIVVAVSEDAPKVLEARLLAQCWKPFGKAQQICCEQIEITANPENWPDIGPTLVGLIAADLPVIVWCRHRAALSASATNEQRAGLEAIIAPATKLIIDTKEDDPKTAIALLNRLATSQRSVADLEWTRLTRWREPIAQIFDGADQESSFSNYRSLEITYTDEQIRPAVLYMAGWLSAPCKADVKLTRTKGFGPGLHSVTLRSSSESVRFERTGKDCMELHSTKGRDRSYHYDEAELDALLNEELAVLGPDPVFDSALARAKELALVDG